MQALAGLHETLWTGPLAAPEAPAQALHAALPQMGYAPALDALRLLSGCALPLAPALDAALARWPWSIDLAMVGVESSRGALPALDILRQRTEQQNRRRAAAGWALWRAGRAQAARAFMAEIDPASQTAAADIACRAELALLDADWPAAEADLALLQPQPDLWHRVMLQQLHLREGAAALAHYLDATPLAQTPHWRQAFDLLLGTLDFARARALLAAAQTHHGADAPEIRAAAILLALEGEAPETALRLLEPALAPAPWRWTQRQHVQWLRATLGRARHVSAPQDDWARAHRHAEAALRLHPRNSALHWLWLSARALCDDWTVLERDLLAMPGAAPAPMLNRLGLHGAAQARQEDELAEFTGVNPRARRLLALAETHLLQGALEAAETALDAAGHLAPPAPTRADLALLRAEIALWRQCPERAEALLRPLEHSFPRRMGLWLSLARAAFLRGDFARAEAALARFRQLKTDQTGTPPATDLRDLITADALAASAALPRGLMTKPLQSVLEQVGAIPIAASPGLSACLLARARPAFVPLADAPPIARRIALYWEGPPSSAVARTLMAWQRLHPGYTVTLYGPAEAEAWLSRHHRALVPLFTRQSLPATRADLFRIALLYTEGGLYADVDEYPSAAVDDWLEGANAVFCVECGHGTIANNFLAARPGLTLFARLLARVQGLLESTDNPYPWWHSGPAPLTATLFEALHGAQPTPGIRLLDQASYCQRISTNLPFPHKRSALHWR